MKRLLKYIFIPVLAILLMSHNVFAVDMSPNVHPIWTNATPDCTLYQYQEGLTFVNEFYNNQSTFRSIYSISCAVPAGLQSKNTYAVYSFTFDNIPDDNSLDSGFRGVKARHGSGGDGGWGVIGYNIQSFANNSAKVDVYLYGEKSNTTAGTVILYNEYNSSELAYLQPKERISVNGASYWQVTTDSDFEYNYTDVLSAISSNINNIDSNVSNIRTGIWRVRDGVDGISQKLDDMAQDTADAINDGQADATQDAADDSSTAGNSSQSSAEGATSNLLSVFAGFANVITNASATNCVINAPLNTSFSNDVFNVDLCGLDLPPAIGTLTSIIAVMVVVPFAISMFNKFVGIMESFQK